MAKVPESVSFKGGDIGGSDERRIAHSLWAMTKDPANYKWKSEKQANFFLSMYKKFGEKWRGHDTYDELIQSNMFVKNPPEGTEMIFSVELHISNVGGRNFGRNYRRLGRIIYMNRNGILRWDKIVYTYDNKGGSGIGKIEQGQPTGIDSTGLAPIEPDKVPQWKIDKETMKTSSVHVGKVGERLTKDLTLIKTLGPYDSSYGSFYINLLKDDVNNVYVYSGGAALGQWGKDDNGDKTWDGLEQGQSASITFTIKAHDERDGTKQNKISRLKVKSKINEEKVMKMKRPIFEKYKTQLNESKQSEQISRSLGYLLSIAENADELKTGIEKAEPMLNKKLVTRLAAILHVISKIKTGKTPNEAPLSGGDDTVPEKSEDDKEEVTETKVESRLGTVTIKGTTYQLGELPWRSEVDMGEGGVLREFDLILNGKSVGQLVRWRKDSRGVEFGFFLGTYPNSKRYELKSSDVKFNKANIKEASEHSREFARSPLDQATKKEKEAFEAGYMQGHNDTVESNYGDPGETADDYLKSRENTPNSNEPDIVHFNMAYRMGQHDYRSGNPFNKESAKKFPGYEAGYNVTEFQDSQRKVSAQNNPHPGDDSEVLNKSGKNDIYETRRKTK